ncbi:hypothetical protein N7466_005182 [Penicillium verhagenii]|uniref:uncharacterized protein n=1 Tax=Penicillium verhagenii TaxID=1562060 RepID=UPI0025456121|nr:uncharacterized protein N7466_005182 [Penicillium verhagenii]KAJ5935635.1 hypothetical protein N7466_005182 [Penicillium verhagenii]
MESATDYESLNMHFRHPSAGIVRTYIAVDGFTLAVLNRLSHRNAPIAMSRFAPNVATWRTVPANVVLILHCMICLSWHERSTGNDAIIVMQ